MEDFDVPFFVFSMPFWDKFIVDETLSIKENLQRNIAFAPVQVEILFLWILFEFPLT
jgi:hypothetical protein